MSLGSSAKRQINKYANGKKLWPKWEGVGNWEREGEGWGWGVYPKITLRLLDRYLVV